MRRLLVANRSEIAIRIFRAASELGIRTFAVYAEEDKLSLHRFKADEAYRIGKGKGPLEAYLSIDEVMRVAKEHRVDAIHPGYGFLSESPEFSMRCREAGIIFIGPAAQTLEVLGDKSSGTRSCQFLRRPGDACEWPASGRSSVHYRCGGGGRLPGHAQGVMGRGRAWHEAHRERGSIAPESVLSARREAKAAFGRDEVCLEKLVRHARHVEVQLLGDTHGNLSTSFRAGLSSGFNGEIRRSSSGRRLPISMQRRVRRCALPR